MKIAVLLGGTSAERDVSFATGLAVADALKSRGHQVLVIDCAYGDQLINPADYADLALVKTDPSDIEKNRQALDKNIFKLIDFLNAEKIDVIFNALHGGYGEDGRLQALLDMAGFRYTGSGSAASMLGMDKHLSKMLFEHHGIATAPWICLNEGQPFNESEIWQLGAPLVIKSNKQGSSVGFSIVERPEDIAAAVAKGFEHDDSVIIEPFIPGKELTVTILGGEALPVIEIRPKSGVYDYESKYQSGKTEYFCPAELDSTVTAELQAAAADAYRVLGCRGYARADFRMREDGRFFCLEVNTLPGMTATSLVPKSAKAAGINFPELIEKIISLA